MTPKIESTSLWQTAFCTDTPPIEESARCKIISELTSFRSRAEQLVGYIQSSLPDLTIHDISHLDALWEVAGLLAGKDYPINPLEAFVFGGAVLLHDAALCIEAYESGLKGIRSTTAWQDTFNIECTKRNEKSIDSIEKFCDFYAMRMLHAERAAELAGYKWKDPRNEDTTTLISDNTLRNHVGSLIGRIAASHHWNIEEVKDRFKHPLNPPTGYPSNWQIDAIKIACLLRAADAAHFCQDRAPDFLIALKSRSGISAAHWNAQNKITGPALYPGDPRASTIVYTSTQDFPEKESRDWWLAYDTIMLIRGELTNCNTLLKQRSLSSAPAFKIKHIAGEESIERFAEFITPSNWEPCNASIHISNIEALVQNLGGEKLYGATKPEHKLHIVLRELIQNARDSIIALRKIEPEYIGQITIRTEESHNKRYITIEDDGIGMSQSVMTGPFLDFGTSFWTSELVKSEFPGLRSTGYKSIGRFGIGFYSTFMIAANVCVSSKRWNKGDDDVTQVVFPDGISLRPIIKKGKPQHHPRGISTSIRIELKESLDRQLDINKLTLPSGIGGVPDVTTTLDTFISNWTIGLDVPIRIISNKEAPKTIHGGTPTNNPTNFDILSRLSLAKYRPNHSQLVKENISKLAPRMREVGNVKFGVAAIQYQANRGILARGVRTIGGLSAYGVGGDEAFVGYIECEPDSARRGPGDFLASPSIIKDWAQNQLEIFEESNPSDLERAVFGGNLPIFDIDPIDATRVIAITEDNSYKPMSIQDIALYAKTTPILFAESYYDSHIDQYAKLTPIPNAIVIYPVGKGDYISLARNNNVPLKPNSIIGCIYRSIINMNMKMKISEMPFTFESLLGQTKTIAITAHPL